MTQRLILSLLIFLLTAPPCFVNAEETAPAEIAKKMPYGVIDPLLLPTAYTDGEVMRYDVFWTGGVKIGELTMTTRRLYADKSAYKIKALITTENGAIHGIYPVRDAHATTVRGEDRLPSRYEVRQKEGYNYQAYRMTKYYQVSKKVVYRKNAGPEEVYPIDGPTHNEFSAFFSSRVMPFKVGESFIVPTFADKKRNEVRVDVLGTEVLEETILGQVETMKIMPVLEFKGLYDKNGDTVIWYTNDECRVPVLINSKLMIGSLTCKLASYENPACQRYIGVTKKPEARAEVALTKETALSGGKNTDQGARKE